MQDGESSQELDIPLVKYMPPPLRIKKMEQDPQMMFICCTFSISCVVKLGDDSSDEEGIFSLSTLTWPTHDRIWRGDDQKQPLESDCGKLGLLEKY